MSDILFSTIEKFHGSRSWGRLLDAGTGLHSIKWIQTLSTTSWNAITADNYMRHQIITDQQVSRRVRPSDSVVVGNWMDNDFVSTLGTYDTILADYLIGAVDGFSPYQQDEIVNKLKRHLNPEGRLYVIGMNPIPDSATPPADIIAEIRQARDACILLAGHRPYREFPVDWMNRHLSTAGFRVIGNKNFTILHSGESASRQIKVARSKLSLMRNKELEAGMDTYLQDLQARLEAAIKAAGGRISLSFDYVIAAEHSNSTAPGSVKVSDCGVFRDIPDMTVAEVADGVNHASISAVKESPLNVVEQEGVFSKLHPCSVRNDIHSSDETVDDDMRNSNSKS